MKPSELYFCIIDGNNSYHEAPGYMMIVFCPQNHWDRYHCLPDYYFADEIDDSLIPDQYKWNYETEEVSWSSTRNKEEINKTISNMGFTHNFDMENFLEKLYSD